MPEVTVNYLAVIVSAVLVMVIGAIWWSPLLFQKAWLKGMGWENKSKADLKKMQKESMPAMFVSFINALIMAYVLSHIIDFANATTWMSGLSTGFWVWLGFVATIGLTETLYAKRDLKLYAINYSYHLISLLATGVILALWV